MVRAVINPVKVKVDLNIFDRFITVMSLDQDTANKRHQILRHNSISYNYNLIIMPDKYFGLA